MLVKNKPFIITVTDETDCEDGNLLHEKLKAEVEDEMGPAERVPFLAVAKDDEGKVRAGIMGVSHWGWLLISHLWVEPESRSSGLGAQLLMHAEHEVKSRKLRGIYLDTFSPRAKKFYIRHGFREFGRIDDFPRDKQRYFLFKKI